MSCKHFPNDEVARCAVCSTSQCAEGYVIRWPGFHGGFKYWSSEHTDPVALDEARVMSLNEASRLFRTLAREAEIVRMRRVEGGERWEKIPDIELSNWLTTTDESRGPEHPTFLSHKVPAAPRWELDPEDDNG